MIDHDKKRVLRIENLFNQFKNVVKEGTPNPDVDGDRKEDGQENQKNRDLYEFYEGIMNT